MAFVAVMLLAGPVIDAMSHVFFKTVDFPEGQPPDRFVVALREAAKAGGRDTFIPVRWKDVAALRASGKKFTFLLPGKEGRLPSRGDLYTYKVIEDRKSSQVIEVHFGNTHRSWSRYEALDDRIVPISYRTDGSFLSLIAAFGLLVLGIFVGRRATKLLRQKFGVSLPEPQATAGSTGHSIGLAIGKRFRRVFFRSK
jgi:hypothetical protein